MISKTKTKVGLCNKLTHFWHKSDTPMLKPRISPHQSRNDDMKAERMSECRLLRNHQAVTNSK